MIQVTRLEGLYGIALERAVAEAEKGVGPIEPGKYPVDFVAQVHLRGEVARGKDYERERGAPTAAQVVEACRAVLDDPTSYPATRRAVELRVKRLAIALSRVNAAAENLPRSVLDRLPQGKVPCAGATKCAWDTIEVALVEDRLSVQIPTAAELAAAPVLTVQGLRTGEEVVHG